MHKKLDEERVAISAGAPGTVPKEITLRKRETLQKQLQESEEKHRKRGAFCKIRSKMKLFGTSSVWKHCKLKLLQFRRVT